MKKLGILVCCLGVVLAASKKTNAKAGDPAKGKAVFEQCAVCHNPDSEEKKVGPGLKGLFKHAKLFNGKKVTEENVLARINEGGQGMPSYEEMLSGQEKADLLAYLKTL